MRISLLLAVTVCLTLTACASKTSYWVDGLTLPPGSSVIGESIDEFEPGTLAFPLPDSGEISRSITVTFDNADGWPGVVSHIDSCLRRAGYSDAMEEYMKTAGAEIPAKERNLIAQRGFAGARMYSKAGGNFAVTLYDVSMAVGTARATSTEMPSTGGFILMVMELR